LRVFSAQLKHQRDIVVISGVVCKTEAYDKLASYLVDVTVVDSSGSMLERVSTDQLLGLK
jgi:hypothetical protein